MKHTPGPWHVGEERGFANNRVWAVDRKHPIAMLLSQGMSPPDLDPEAQANAKLIAAAPDLLAALETLCKALAPIRATKATLEAYDKAKAAIAKATE